jgi:hypothetical protein
MFLLPNYLNRDSGPRFSNKIDSLHLIVRAITDLLQAIKKEAGSFPKLVQVNSFHLFFVLSFMLFPLEPLPSRSLLRRAFVYLQTFISLSEVELALRAFQRPPATHPQPLVSLRSCSSF